MNGLCDRLCRTAANTEKTIERRLEYWGLKDFIEESFTQEKPSLSEFLTDHNLVRPELSPCRRQTATHFAAGRGMTASAMVIEGEVVELLANPKAHGVLKRF